MNGFLVNEELWEVDTPRRMLNRKIKRTSLLTLRGTTPTITTTTFPSHLDKLSITLEIEQLAQDPSYYETMLRVSRGHLFVRST